jgi:MFS family permease
VKIARDSLALFHRRDFTLLMAAQWLAQAADGLVGVSLAKHIAFGGQAGFSFEDARTTEEVLRIVLLTILPYTFISPFAGVLIDRWDRRRLLILSTGFRALVLSLIAAAGFERIGDLALYGSFLLLLASTRLLLAIKGASLPAVLEERDLLHGNSLSQAGSAIFQLGGAGAGLVGSGFLDTRFLVAGGAALYLAAAVFAFAIRRLGYGKKFVPLRQEIGRIVHDLVEGLREVGRRPMAALSLTSFLGLRALVSFVVLAVALASRAYLAREGSFESIIAAAAGALGAGVGFVSAHALKDRVPPARILVFALLAAGIGVLAFGGIITITGLSLVAFSVGFGFFLGKVSVDTIMQEALSDSFRGRGFGLQDLVYNLSWIIPSLVLWAAWSPTGVRPLLLVAGGVFLATGGGVALWARQVERSRVEPSPSSEGPS